MKARVELTFKFNAFPNDAKELPEGWMQLDLNCDGHRFLVPLRPKAWNRLVEAQKTWPQWIAVVTGKIGSVEQGAVIVAEPGLQVFEKKPKSAG